jgi:hypothetical protein
MGPFPLNSTVSIVRDRLEIQLKISADSSAFILLEILLRRNF